MRAPMGMKLLKAASVDDVLKRRPISPTQKQTNNLFDAVKEEDEEKHSSVSSSSLDDNTGQE